MALDVLGIVHKLVLIGLFCLGSGLLALGTLCFVQPCVAAEAFGLPCPGDPGFIFAVGARDGCIGLMALALLYSPQYRNALRPLGPILSLLPVADFFITLHVTGDHMKAAPHLFGAFCVCALSVFAWLDPTMAKERKQD